MKKLLTRLLLAAILVASAGSTYAQDDDFIGAATGEEIDRLAFNGDPIGIAYANRVLVPDAQTNIAGLNGLSLNWISIGGAPLASSYMSGTNIAGATYNSTSKTWTVNLAPSQISAATGSLPYITGSTLQSQITSINNSIGGLSGIIGYTGTVDDLVKWTTNISPYIAGEYSKSAFLYYFYNSDFAYEQTFTEVATKVNIHNATSPSATFSDAAYGSWQNGAFTFSLGGQYLVLCGIYNAANSSTGSGAGTWNATGSGKNCGYYTVYLYNSANNPKAYAGVLRVGKTTPVFNGSAFQYFELRSEYPLDTYSDRPGFDGSIAAVLNVDAGDYLQINGSRMIYGAMTGSITMRAANYNLQIIPLKFNTLPTVN